MSADDAWKAEIERRVATHERGEGKRHDAEDVMRRGSRLEGRFGFVKKCGT